MFTIQSIQIELLVWGSVFCLIAALCMFLSTNFDKQKRKWLFWLQLSTSLLLGGDVLAYKFRGYPGLTGRIMVSISNFTVFAISNVILLLFHAYICSYLFSKKEDKEIVRVKLVYIIGCVGVLLVVISQFTNLYYYFDENNFYHRNTAYWISLFIPVICMAMDFSLLLQFHKNVSRKMFVSMLSYVTLPPMAACFQLFCYGISLINLSIAVSMIIMYVVATSELNVEMFEVLKRKAEIEQSLEIATTLNRCVTALSSDADSYIAINNLLEIISDYFQSDRSYIFEINYNTDTLSNTHEYVREGISTQKDNLQEMPLEVVSVWMENFKKNQVYYISDIETQKGHALYDVLCAQEVKCLLAAPLCKEETILGFLGVDNPKKHYEDATLLSAIQYFVTNSLSAKKQQEQLQYLSYRDMLTRLYNRNKYMDTIEAFQGQSIQRIGVAYIDLNGLKTINDKLGHEAGDRLICTAAQIIADTFSNNAYRVGGDEFVIICPEIEEQKFYQEVDAICRKMKQKGVSISTGVLWRIADDNLQEMLKEADGKMYKEKEQYYKTTGAYRR